MSRLERAQALRDEGRTYREIGAAFGVAGGTARRWLNPEAAEANRVTSRAAKARRKGQLAEYDRRYALEHRHPCPECGHMLDRRSTGEECRGCVRARREQVVAWWAEGLTTREIAARLGWTTAFVGVELHRIRQAGYDLPHRYAPDRIAKARERRREKQVAA